ncbi:MAG: flippase-like domain-containing protein [Anaerolineae bacterium]|nr:flippase-like domain-containing protein [Anaerolineae bacterium]
MSKRVLRIITTLLLSALALAIALRGIDLNDVGHALARVDWVWAGVTLVLILGTLVMRAARWRVLLGRVLPLVDTLGLISIGYLISGVLPLRAGDPARAVAASLRARSRPDTEPISAIVALSTVVVERVLDMLLIVLVLLASLPLVPELRGYLASGRIGGSLSINLVLALSGVASFCILLAFILIAVFPDTTLRLARRALRLLHITNIDRWLKPLQSIIKGMGALRSPRDGLALGFWSLALWTTTAAYFFAMLWACRAFIPEPSVLKSVVAMWASAFGMVFPATGGIGSFHFAVREAFYWGFAIPRDLGFTYAVLVHALPYLTGIVLGALALAISGMSLQTLVKRGQEIEAPVNSTG